MFPVSSEFDHPNQAENSSWIDLSIQIWNRLFLIFYLFFYFYFCFSKASDLTHSILNLFVRISKCSRFPCFAISKEKIGFVFGAILCPLFHQPEVAVQFRSMIREHLSALVHGWFHFVMKVLKVILFAVNNQKKKWIWIEEEIMLLSN
jgi:hypothetical protein